MCQCAHVTRRLLFSGRWGTKTHRSSSRQHQTAIVFRESLHRIRFGATATHRAPAVNASRSTVGATFRRPRVRRRIIVFCVLSTLVTTIGEALPGNWWIAGIVLLGLAALYLSLEFQRSRSALIDLTAAVRRDHPDAFVVSGRLDSDVADESAQVTLVVNAIGITVRNLDEKETTVPWTSVTSLRATTLPFPEKNALTFGSRTWPDEVSFVPASPTGELMDDAAFGNFTRAVYERRPVPHLTKHRRKSARPRRRQASP